MKAILANNFPMPVKARSMCLIGWLCPKWDQHGSQELRSLHRSPGRRAKAANRGKRGTLQESPSLYQLRNKQTTKADSCIPSSTAESRYLEIA